MAASRVELTGDRLPSPSRSLLYAVFGLIILAAVVLLVMLVTPRDSGPGVGGPYDALEAEITEVYGLENVTYTSPATSTFSGAIDGVIVMCVVPTAYEFAQRLPLVCGDGIVIPAK